MGGERLFFTRPFESRARRMHGLCMRGRGGRRPLHLLAILRAGRREGCLPESGVMELDHPRGRAQRGGERAAPARALVARFAIRSLSPVRPSTPLPDSSYLAELLLDKGYIVHGLKRRASSYNHPRLEHIMDASECR